MPVELPQELIDLFADHESTKALATTDENGIPHLVFKQSLQLRDDGKVIYLELLESSRTNRNMVRSIWFDRMVAITIKGKGDRCYQIKGKPVKTYITGPVFRKYYQQIREQLGDVDLAGVWVIDPEQVTDESFATRHAEEAIRHPHFNHLDRLAKSPNR